MISLVRWFRKNNKKIMAVVVIVILFGFIGGGFIQQMSRRRTGLGKTVAWFGDGNKITRHDLALAAQEMEILKALRVDILLRNINVPTTNVPSLQAILLAELLFSDRNISPQLRLRIEQLVRIGEYKISSKQLNDIYRGALPANVYWLLLKNEAQQAGIRQSNKKAGTILGQVVPKLAGGATYSQLIGTIMEQQGISEERILTTFGKLLAVLDYAKMICSSEDITSAQIKHNISLANETIDVEFVRFGSSVFAETADEPTQQQIIEHFDKYKEIFRGEISDENPYGFGYKLPDRVQLEYIAVKIDDVVQIITPLKPEHIEEYYQRNRQRFTEQIPSDPNDANSALVERTKSYAEMAGIISEQLELKKIYSKADKILAEAKALTEAGFGDVDTAELGAEQFRQMAGDYAVAGELSDKYKIKIYSGRTGLLSAADIQTDKYLGRLFLKGYGNNPVRLVPVIFAVEQLQASELGPFDVAEPRLYENIGPAADVARYTQIQTVQGIKGQIMAVVRIIKAEKASVPESVEQTFNRETLKFDEPEEKTDEDIYSVKEEVVEDLRRLAAMDTAKAKTEEFIELAQKDGWDKAIDEFNKRYGKKNKQNENAPDTFELRHWTGLPRLSSVKLETLAAQSKSNPALKLLIDETKKQRQFREQLYSLIPADKETGDSLPLVLEFKPNTSFYCIKNISVERLSKEEYEKLKAKSFYQQDIVQSQSLAPVHFNPENILKRMAFRWTNE